MHEKNNSSRKVIVLVLVLSLLLGCAAGGTFAWLVAKAEPLANTFAPGNINLTLTEPSWETNVTKKTGKFDAEGNEIEVEMYKTLPGDMIPKDPTVTVGAGSADCYVRLFVVIWWEPYTDSHFWAEDSDDWFVQKASSEYTGNWWQNGNCISLYDHTNDSVLGIVNEYRYTTKIKTSAVDQKLRPLFDYIQVPTNLGQEQFASLDNFKLIIFAQAVQADGFADMNAAFDEAGLPNITLDDCVDAGGNAQTLEQIIAALKAQSYYNNSNG